MPRCNESRIDRRDGSVVTLVCILMPALLTIMAYCIHVSHAESMHSRTQMVADIIARSAGRNYVRTGNRQSALAAAQTAAARNPVGDAVIPVAMSDLEFGISDRTAVDANYVFAPLGDDDARLGNAVRFTSHSLRNAEQAVLPNLFPNFGRITEIRPLMVAANTQGSMDISVVLDRSGSMRYAADEAREDPYAPPAAEPAGWVPGDPVADRSKWLDTVAAVDAFVAYLQQSPQLEQICLSTYASDTRTDLQLTTDVESIRAAMDANSQSFHGGATAIGMGMQEGLGAITDPSRSRPWASRVMLLMTDGQHNLLLDPEEMIEDLTDNHVLLYTVTFGDAADQTRMRALAQQCGGEHFHADNGSQLNHVFRDIAQRLPSLMTQ